MDEWDRGYWCDVCRQRHYQISPACVERRRQREYAETEEGRRASRALVEHLRELRPIPWARAREMGFPYIVPNGADEEKAEDRRC